MQQIQPPDTREELDYLLPEIRFLPKEPGIQAEVAKIFIEDAPEYFWSVRGSESYHPKEHQARHGLYIHTKRTFTAYTSMAGSLEASGVIDRPEYVFGTVASLIHDLWKYGDPEGFQVKANQTPPNEHEYAEGLEWVPRYSTRDHDLVAAAYVRADTSLPADVANLVETHQGNGFGDGPGPRNWSEWIHHLSDVAASRSKCDWFLMDPPEVVLEQYPHLTESVYSLEDME